MGYRDPILNRKYPALVDDDDRCFVILRNPVTMPGTELTSMLSGGDNEDAEARMQRVRALIANLVIGWRVWDPRVPIKADPETGDLIHDEETEPRLMPLPATPELVAILPPVIQTDLMAEVTKAITPQKPTQTPEDGTGNPS